jgi:hypothetical protein
MRQQRDAAILIGRRRKAMLYRVLADAVVVVHLAFIIFVFFGGLLTFRWPKLAWAHVPSFLWGGGIGLFGWICPLTYLENDLRSKSAAQGYTSSFVEAYLLPAIYPERLFGSFPRSGFIAIGVFILVLNAVIYWRLYRRLRSISEET